MGRRKMKKIFTWMMLCGTLVLSLAGCGGTDPKVSSSQETKQVADAGKASASDGKVLIVYYSWSGNTKRIAEEIQKQTGADVFEIIPEKQYTKDYDAVVKLAKEEKNNNVRPAISGKIDHLENYDVVFVGFPNWWSDMPMVLYTFFDAYDLSGKKIVPFCTSGGGEFASSLNSIKSLEPNADILEGLHISGSAAGNPQGAVANWLNELCFAK